MTQAEIQKLKDAVEAAQAAAADAAAAAQQDPTPEKLAAKSESEARLEKARADLAQAEADVAPELQSVDTSAQIQAYKGRVILLTIYLLAVVMLSIYLLAGFFMAETDRAEIEKRRKEDACCRTSTNTNTNANGANSITTNSNGNSTSNSNANISGGNSNANTANANATQNINAGATGSSANSTGAGNPSNATDHALTPTSPTATPATNSEIPEISVPKYIYVKFFGWPTGGIWSAESYLFLVVFLAGVLGGTIRAMHSLVKHLGLKDFSFYWSWFYITLPLSGGGLAIVIYFVLRGGFYEGGFGKGLVLNVFSFAALGALTGLFTDNAMEKLKKVADVLLADVEPKVDNAKEIQEKKEADKKKP